MKCPIDNNDLQTIDRNGVEIDHCPKCRGVWLDRGELDKIIERAGGANQPSSSPEPQRATITAAESSREVDQHGRPKKNRRSFLEDLFDF